MRFDLDKAGLSTVSFAAAALLQRANFSRVVSPASALFLAFLATVWPNPAAAQNGYAPPKQETLTPTGVSLVDGRFTFQNDDFGIGSLTLTRFHQGGKPKGPEQELQRQLEQ